MAIGRHILYLFRLSKVYDPSFLQHIAILHFASILFLKSGQTTSQWLLLKIQVMQRRITKGFLDCHLLICQYNDGISGGSWSIKLNLSVNCNAICSKSLLRVAANVYSALLSQNCRNVFVAQSFQRFCLNLPRICWAALAVVVELGLWWLLWKHSSISSNVQRGWSGSGWFPTRMILCSIFEEQLYPDWNYA